MPQCSFFVANSYEDQNSLERKQYSQNQSCKVLEFISFSPFNCNMLCNPFLSSLFYIMQKEKKIFLITHIVPPCNIVERWIGFDVTFKVDISSLQDVFGVKTSTKCDYSQGNIWNRKVLVMLASSWIRTCWFGSPCMCTVLLLEILQAFLSENFSKWNQSSLIASNMIAFDKLPLLMLPSLETLKSSIRNPPGLDWVTFVLEFVDQPIIRNNGRSKNCGTYLYFFFRFLCS